jgi:hypothetical protein
MTYTAWAIAENGGMYRNYCEDDIASTRQRVIEATSESDANSTWLFGLCLHFLVRRIFQQLSS